MKHSQFMEVLSGSNIINITFKLKVNLKEIENLSWSIDFYHEGGNKNIVCDIPAFIYFNEPENDYCFNFKGFKVDKGIDSSWCYDLHMTHITEKYNVMGETYRIVQHCPIKRCDFIAHMVSSEYVDDGFVSFDTDYINELCLPKLGICK